MSTLSRSLPWALAAALVGAILPGVVHAQDESTSRTRLLATLTQRQQRSADELRTRLDQMRALGRDLRERGELDKANLLDEAVRMVTDQRIGVGSVATGTGTTHEQLVGLELALRRMATLLERRGDAASAEVQDLGKKVTGELSKIVDILTGRNEVEDLERRMRAVEKARRTAKEIADRQRKLRRDTKRTVPRTEAEKIAERARRDLDKLQRQIEALDEQTRSQLRDVDRARERAARLQDLVNLQQRLRKETGVRAGDTDKVTPKVNRLRADMQDIARKTKRNESQTAKQQDQRELARQVGELARRQEQIARQTEARAALERARESLRRDGPDEARSALAEAADATERAGTPEAKKRAEELRAAAKALTPEKGRKQATEAIKSALDKLSPRKTLAGDQVTLARDIQRVLDRAKKAADQDALEEARKHAEAAAADMKAGKPGARQSREAAEALKKVAAAMAKTAQATGKTKAAEQRAASHEAGARNAEKTAQALDKLAEDKAAKNAGLRQTAKNAADAMRKAAKELKQAAKSARAGETERERRQAEAARERIERAERSLKEALEQGEDLTDRQGKVAQELENLAQGTAGKKPSSKEAEQLKATAGKAQAAQESLKKGEYKKAGKQQDEILDKLKKLAQKAEGDAKAAAERNAGALQRAQEGSKAAADRAQAVRGKLEEGAKKAREHDAKERLNQAADAVKKSEEAMRRSLRRLKAAMPKSAEEDRRQAKENLKEARRALDGVRERHNPNGQQREQLKRLAEKQKALRDDVKRLEEHVKKTKQDAGRERLQDAESAMRDAQRAMEQGDSDEAEKAQERAEKALKEVQRDMSEEERRYRSLRQYELLFKLREELNNFRRSAQAHRETLAKIDANVRQAGRVTRSIRRSEIKPLGKRVRALHRDIDEKAVAIKKEGAIVYSYILGGCVTDLEEVATQLSLRETGLVPQELVGDVVRRLDLAIRGLERDLKEKQADQQQQQKNQQNQQKGQQPGRTGEPRLVPPGAEIRMVLVLQRELNKERGTFFDNRPDLNRRSPSATEKARLERMYHEQGSLAELFDSLRRSLAERGRGDEPDFGDNEESEEDEG